MKDEMNVDSRQEQISAEAPRHEHKPLTAAQNVMLTVKVLIGAAIVFAAIMAIDRLAS